MSFESILAQFSNRFSNHSKSAERSEAVVVGGGGGGGGGWWWWVVVVGGRAASNCLHMLPDASK